MIKLKPLTPIGKKLRLFDFDGTLARSNARIIVKRPNEPDLRLDGYDFAYYDLNPGESFDFSEFENQETPTLIKYTVKILSAMYKTQTELHSIYVLTARGKNQTDTIRQFLDMHGFNNVEIAPMGHLYPGMADEEKKAKWVEEKINEGYNDIIFFDDIPLNLEAVGRLRQKYPKVKIVLKLIRRDFKE